MDWTDLSSFMPLIRIGAAAAAAVTLVLTVRGVRAEARSKPLGAAVAARKGLVAGSVAVVLAAAWILTGASSAHRPKDAVEADHSARDQMLRQIDEASKPVVPRAGSAATDWNAARDSFRERIRQEQEQFERATAKSADTPRSDKTEK